MEKKFNIVVGEDGTVKLPDEVLEKLEVKPGEEVRFEVDDNFYAVRLLSRIEAERLDYLNWMHPINPKLYCRHTDTCRISYLDRCPKY